MFVVEGNLEAPNLCAVCEGRPADARFVDSGFNNSYLPPSPVTGRKYLCEGCVDSAAKALGYATPEAHAVAQAKVEEQRSKIDELHVRVKDFESGAIDRFLAVAEGVKPAAPKAAPKPRIKKAESAEARGMSLGH